MSPDRTSSSEIRLCPSRKSSYRSFMCFRTYRGEGETPQWLFVMTVTDWCNHNDLKETTFYHLNECNSSATTDFDVSFSCYSLSLVFNTQIIFFFFICLIHTLQRPCFCFPNNSPNYTLSRTSMWQPIQALERDTWQLQFGVFSFSRPISPSCPKYHTSEITPLPVDLLSHRAFSTVIPR